MAGARRIERLLAVLETAVLPLNDAPMFFWRLYYTNNPPRFQRTRIILGLSFNKAGMVGNCAEGMI